ncbi:MAG: hypothetical protein O7J95_06965, partial [Planctomycetota bacterium]|nr:hypothetical protein [Planctomycetota bacterium]
MAPIRRIVIRAAIIGALLILWAISAAQSSARGAARESPAGGGARDAGTAMLRLATFDIDVTPPVGSMMAYDPVVRHDDLPLRCRGIVLSGAGQPIVLCAFDWIGIANESHDAVRDALAAAAKTVRSRVTVHTIHQHDAPVSDLLAEKLLRRAGAETGRYDGDLTRKVLRRLDAAVRRAVAHPRPVTHVGFGQADVERVASNR